MSDWSAPKTWAVGEEAISTDLNTYLSDNTIYLLRKESATTVSGTTTETALFNLTIPANLMGSHRRAQISADGAITNNTGGARNGPRFRLKLGGTTIFDIDFTVASIAQLNASATAGAWMFTAEIKQMNSTAAQESFITGKLADGTDMNFTTGSGIVRDYNSAHGKFFWGRFNTTVDMTADRALTWTVVNGYNNASYSTAINTATVAIL